MSIKLKTSTKLVTYNVTHASRAKDTSIYICTATSTFYGHEFQQFGKN